MTMRTNRPIFVFLLCCTLLAGACSKRVEPTTVEVHDPVRHYFPILQGQHLDLVFQIVNTGDNPLVITEIQTSCGCLVAERKSRIIVPPERTEHLRLSYDSNKNVGAVSHTIWVYGNIVPSGVVKLKFDVNVVPDAAYTRDYEELYREYAAKNGPVQRMVDGAETEKGYYVDGEFD